MIYTFQQHIHNYAVWTAARAAQRGFTTTENIKQAINASQLQKLAEGKLDIKTAADYDAFHKITCDELMATFDSLSLKDRVKAKATFGRAAKIVAVYLKTAVVVKDQGESLLSNIIHPPIDRILLSNLTKPPYHIQLRNWTQLSKHDYYVLWEEIKALKIHKKGFWEIEEHWES